jgi:alpha,alpha-trehalase
MAIQPTSGQNESFSNDWLAEPVQPAAEHGGWRQWVRLLSQWVWGVEEEAEPVVPSSLKEQAWKAALRTPAQYPWALRYAMQHHLYAENKYLADAIPRREVNPSHRMECLARSVMLGALAGFQGRHPLHEAVRSWIDHQYSLLEPPDTFLPQHAVLTRPLALVDPPEESLMNLLVDVKSPFLAIHHHWPRLVRQTPDAVENNMIPLPFPYVVPGGRFTEMYYWDSYFTLLGLEVSGLSGLIQGMVENCLHLVERFGRVPNGNRTYYLSRSQPPFLTAMITMAWECRRKRHQPDDLAWLERAYELAQREYTEYWMDPSTHYVESFGLNRYMDPVDQFRPESWGTDNLHTPNTPEFYLHERAECESGWDFTDRFNGRCADFLPVDLNCLLYRYEKDLCAFALRLERSDEAVAWHRRAERRKKRLMQFCWNELDGLFYDFDLRLRRQFRYPTLAGYYALWAGLATTAQVRRMVKNLPLFEREGGLMTSLHVSGKQWDAPNGWAPLQWIVIDGLKRYHYHQHARRLAQKWVNLCARLYHTDGKFYEKYNVVACNAETPGCYPLQDGFGWTNAVYQKLMVSVLGYRAVSPNEQRVISLAPYHADEALLRGDSEPPHPTNAQAQVIPLHRLSDPH